MGMGNIELACGSGSNHHRQQILAAHAWLSIPNPAKLSLPSVMLACVTQLPTSNCQLLVVQVRTGAGSAVIVHR